MNQEPARKLYLDRNLQVIFCITLTAIMSVSSLAPAFPKIIDELGISPTSVGLLITVFTMPGVILTPLFGVLADRYGRKKVIVPSLFVFGIAGFSCGFIRDFELLLVLRFFQGMGAACLGSMNATLIGDLFKGRNRTRAMGYNSSVLSIGTTVYPAIGGALAAIAWYYPFFMAILGVPVGFLVMFVLKNPEPDSKQSLRDYLRNLAISLNDRRVIGLFLSCGSTFIILYGSYLTYIPILMHNKFGSSEVVIGIMMSSVSIVTAVTASQLGRITGIIPEKRLLKLSFIVYSLSLLITPFAENLAQMTVPVFLFGIAHGTNIPVTISLLAGLAPTEYRGAFMATNGMVLRLGQTIGPIAAGVMYALGGISLSFHAGAILALSASLFLTIVFYGEK